MGGSILPATIHENKIYFLFGKERDIDENPGWSDFGGGSEKNESLLHTACREGSEESTGFFGSANDIQKKILSSGTYKIDYDSNEGYSTYRVHLFPMKYDEFLTYYYNNNQHFLQKHLDPKVIRDTKIFEKTQIKWFSFQDIKKNKKQFRSFYQNIVELILQNEHKITTFMRSRDISRKNISRKKKTSKKKTNKRK